MNLRISEYIAVLPLLLLSIMGFALPLSGLAGDKTYNLNDKIPNSERRMVLNRETGRIIVFLRYLGEEPIKLSETGYYFDPTKLITSASIIDPLLSNKYDNNPNKAVEEGLTIIGNYSISTFKEGRIAGHAPNWPPVDTTYVLKKGEFVGSWCYIWELPVWDKLGSALKKYRKPYELTATGAGLYDEKRPRSQYSFEIDLPFFQKMEALKLKKWRERLESYNRTWEAGIDWYEENIVRTPVTEVNGKEKYPTVEWKFVNEKTTLDREVSLNFDQESGMLFSYLGYEGTIYRLYEGEDRAKPRRYKEEDFSKPKYFDISRAWMASNADYKTLDLRILESTVMNVRTSIAGLVDDYFTHPKYRQCETEEEVQKFSWTRFYSFGSNEDPNDPGRSENQISPKSLDRESTLENERYVFGSACYIWEIGNWEELGKRIKDHKQAFYIFSCASSDVVDRIRNCFAPEDCVKVDEKLYDKMEALRKAVQSK
jgi:hypothetical protein